MRRVSHLLLDLDGTLVDTFPGVRAGLLHALDTLGHPHPDEAFLAGIAGPPMEETLAAAGVPAEQVPAGLKAYLDYAAGGGWLQASPFPGVAELLAGWHDEGLVLATATSKGEHFARITLEHFGLLDYIDFLGAAEEDGPRRTKTAVLEHTLTNLGLKGPKPPALMIGDRIHDFDGARAFGIDSVAVAWGYGTDAERAHAIAVAADPAELERIVHDRTR